MDVDFDKEIDTLLRKAHRDAPVLVGDFASSGHLDADAISAFAENAMPEKSRALYSAHLADCDRCRKILSNLLVMNAEAAPAAAPSLSAITIAERAADPWYKRLFLFPNLAYVMGSLVLIFGGFLAFTVIRNSGTGDTFVSQAPDSAETRGSNFQTEPDLSAATANSNAASNMAANTAAANTASVYTNSSSAARPITENTPAAGPRAAENNFVVDGADSTSAPAAAPVAAAAPPAPKDAERDRDDAKAKVEEKAAGLNVLTDVTKNDNNISKQQQYSVPAQSGPMRNNESQYNRQLENLERRSPSAKRKAERAEDEGTSGRRVVNGRTFERKQSVWYDVSYQGRPTINVRRGTDEYNRLDGGLRAIANSLNGTIVVVWGAKAYRIQ